MLMSADVVNFVIARMSSDLTIIDPAPCTFNRNNCESHIMNNVSVFIKTYRCRTKISTLTFSTAVHCAEHHAKEDLVRIKHLRNVVKGTQMHSLRECLMLASGDV